MMSNGGEGVYQEPIINRLNICYEKPLALSRRVHHVGLVTGLGGTRRL
jgi:hypothetical protein